MAVTIFLAALLGGYSIYVIRKKIKDMKRGKFCSCDCGHCSGSCGKVWEEER